MGFCFCSQVYLVTFAGDLTAVRISGGVRKAGVDYTLTWLNES